MGHSDSAVLPKRAADESMGGLAVQASGLPALRSIQEIDCLLASLVASWQVSPQVFQCRRSHRVRFCKPVALTPLDESGLPCEETFIALGRDISLGGISFQHHQPLPYRSVAITFQSDSESSESVVTRLSWCRFTRNNAYYSGGKFLRTIKLARLSVEDWDRLSPA